MNNTAIHSISIITSRQTKGILSCLAFLILLMPITCMAHFGVILPSDDIVESSESHQLELKVEFMHPFEQEYMNMARPAKFGYMTSGKATNLLDALEPVEIHRHKAWKANMTIKRPGDHLFYVVPQPYWEPAEDCYIQHFTKVIVNAFGMEEGWSEPVGLEAEIIPLTRPYGLWSGNEFRGKVLFRGKPAAGVDVEIEYYNTPDKDGKQVVAPAPPYVTQVVRTDENGIFSYTMPKAGWWGFAALITDPNALKHDGKPVDVEKGAVIWVKTRDMVRK